MHQNYAQLIRGAFNNLSQINDQKEVKAMVDYMRAHPVEAFAIFQQAKNRALSASVKDTITGFAISSWTTIVTVSVGHEIVLKLQEIADAFKALRQKIQGRF